MSHKNNLAPVVQKVDSAIHRINHYSVDKYINTILCVIRSMAIYPLDSAIHLLNNRGQTI